MSCPLPPELLDLIVDPLRDEPAMLKACCIVSKSWISRTRKYLFAHIYLYPPERSIELWKQTFPDPSSSLARHTRTISFLEPSPAAFVNPDVIDWIHSFHRVEHLFLNFFRRYNHEVSLIQLHGFSSALRSLSLAHLVVGPKLFDFISSFPFLEDLALTAASHNNDTGEWISPSTSPRFTGSLRISGAIPSITRWLCGLPGGLHFREINTSLYDEDKTSMTDLVSRCSSTLESLTIASYSWGGQHLLDLSTATKLKDVVFDSDGTFRWINTAIETIKSKDLERVTIKSRYVLLNYREWWVLDRALAQLWTSRSIRPTITFSRRGKLIEIVSELLPELTKKGAVDVFERDD